MQDLTLVQKIASIADDRKARNIVALDVRELTVVCSYMIIISGRNLSHTKAICDAIEEKLGEEDILPIRSEGYQDAHWIILDYGHIMVHIFHQEERDYYNLEHLWDDGTNKLTLALDAE